MKSDLPRTTNGQHLSLFYALVVFVALGQTENATSRAQQFRLSAPEFSATSIANLTKSRMEIIDSQGQVNVYLRDFDFDSDDEKWLTHIGLDDVGLQPLVGLPTQMWTIFAPPAAEMALLQPFWRSVQSEIRPNPRIRPAEVEMMNTHQNPLTILVADQRQNPAVQILRIEANNSARITVERDTGATLVETVEVLSPLGDWSRQDFVTQIPPSRSIDLSVYEEFLQSIAIDRTGKSPNRIEDINYAPRSVGLVLLSAGSELPERSSIDIYSLAVAANNPGAVRRLNPEPKEKKGLDPIESILERERDREQEPKADSSEGRRSF